MEKKPALDLLNNISEIDIVYKRKVTCKASERPQVSSSADTYHICLHYWTLGKIELLEEFKILFLNRSNRVLQLFALSQGGITGTVADPRLILAVALKLAASSIILVHNHPSGCLIPSKADEETTQKIKAAARYLDIKLLDHLIISLEGYYSFADEGLL